MTARASFVEKTAGLRLVSNAIFDAYVRVVGEPHVIVLMRSCIWEFVRVTAL